ncbi:MAG: hemerythrin domain-containing protein [Gammaproteobacteria bacterium]|nr:hemerythrin domain-containing protein [Gammaproteobacteria bacterium]
MLQINARTRVTDLMKGPPGLMAALTSTGIFRDGDDPDVTIGELCWNFGFNPGILVMVLEAANIPEERPPLDIAPYRAMPLSGLVDHIEQVHHAYLRRELPRLTSLAAAVAAEQAGDGRLGEVNETVSRLARELDAHLLHEEEALFPMARQLGAGTAIAPTRCGDSVGGPIACMETEHEDATRALRKLRELTADYAMPDGAGAPFGELMVALAAFDRDLREHMFKEDEALFPRALEAQRLQRLAATAS